MCEGVAEAATVFAVCAAKAVLEVCGSAAVERVHPQQQGPLRLLHLSPIRQERNDRADCGGHSRKSLWQTTGPTGAS